MIIYYYVTLESHIYLTVTKYLLLWVSAFNSRTWFSHLDYSGEEASMNQALSASPLANMYNEKGEYPVVLANEFYQGHPLGLCNNITIIQNAF